MEQRTLLCITLFLVEVLFGPTGVKASNFSINGHSVHCIHSSMQAKIEPQKAMVNRTQQKSIQNNKEKLMEKVPNKTGINPSVIPSFVREYHKENHATLYGDL